MKLYLPNWSDSSKFAMFLLGALPPRHRKGDTSPPTQTDQCKSTPAFEMTSRTRTSRLVTRSNGAQVEVCAEVLHSHTTPHALSAFTITTCTLPRLAQHLSRPSNTCLTALLHSYRTLTLNDVVANATTDAPHNPTQPEAHPRLKPAFRLPSPYPLGRMSHPPEIRSGVSSACSHRTCRSLVGI